MERPLTCGCTTGECDGLACCSVVSTTAHGHGVADRHAMKPDSGDCIKMQVAPKAHHPNKSSGLVHGCPPNDNTQVTTNRLPMIGNTMILVRLENRT
uniref:Uncharacterized protein n=1 Tax=Hyaloperonospora arabidopsidis (strain Emoy2) TaxID=559515 RepID=M4B4E4_HYAAE